MKRPNNQSVKEGGIFEIDRGSRSMLQLPLRILCLGAALLVGTYVAWAKNNIH